MGVEARDGFGAVSRRARALLRLSEEVKKAVGVVDASVLIKKHVYLGVSQRKAYRN